MKNITNLNEAIDVLKKLSPQNQAYFMTLVQVAQISENGMKNKLHIQNKLSNAKESKIEFLINQ